MRLLAALLLGCLFWPVARAAGDPSGEHSLLDLARELAEKREPQIRRDYYTDHLRSTEHALEQAHAPGDADCARSLGAPVYAELHLDVGRARKANGDLAGAVQAFRRAQACTPHDPFIFGNIADALFEGRDLVGARAAVQQALAINPRGVYLNHIAGNIDFIDGRWADAVSRFRYAASSDKDREQAGYAQLLYWLAQMRAGVRKPEFVARRHPDGWPKPLLLYMQGQYTEVELVSAVSEDDSEYLETRTDQRLCQALYYVGEAHWARGHPELARDYFTAAVNIKELHLDEHAMALAEIARLRKK